MRKFSPCSLALALSLSACGTPSPTPNSVCADIAAVKSAPDAAVQLASLDPHSKLGVLWADAQSGCPNGVPAAGVNATWTQEVWAMAKGLIPQVLPQLVPLLIGML
jgi:hypothetical protein